GISTMVRAPIGPVPRAAWRRTEITTPRAGWGREERRVRNPAPSASRFCTFPHGLGHGSV
ncbi:MAG: hypothetical protein KDK08_13550, partial [Rhizobiaceae bacterium]|nr:hypothetical protein [Rhizobiaceae bacterium]